VEAWYPGYQGGNAIADVLFGAYNPGGRLPFTLYARDYVDQVSMFDMGMAAPAPGRTYRYFTGTPVFPFGWGLSYTNFSLSWSAGQAGTGTSKGTGTGTPTPTPTPTLTTRPPLHARHIAAAAEATASRRVALARAAAAAAASLPVAEGNREARRLLRMAREETQATAGTGTVPNVGAPLDSLSVAVTNTGPLAGDEVVLVFWEPPANASSPLLRQLVAFQRVHLQPNATAHLTFQVAPEQLLLHHPHDGTPHVPLGRHALVVTDGVEQQLRVEWDVEGEGGEEAVHVPLFVL